MMRRFAFAATLPLSLCVMAAQAPQPKTVPPPKAMGDFLRAQCFSCHDHTSKAGNLDLTALPFDLNDSRTFATWVKVHDRVRSGEMPPKGMPVPPATAKTAFLKAVATSLTTTDDTLVRREGRAVWRRMNRYEYENTLRDLLRTPWLQIRDMLPEDGTAYHFNKVGERLDVSHVQMSRYLAAAEYAIREAMAPQAVRPETTIKRYYARQMGSFTGPSELGNFNGAPERATFLLIGNTPDAAAQERRAPMTVGEGDPQKREQESVGVIASAYEPLEPTFDQFRAPVSGRYWLRVNAYSFWAGPESERRWWRASRNNISVGRTTEPVTLYAQYPPRQLRKLATFDAVPETNPSGNTPYTVEVYLQKGETLRPDAARLMRSRPPGWRNPLAQKDGQPGVAFHWLEVRGPIYDNWPNAGHRALFGDLPIKADATGKVEVVSEHPDTDGERLLRQFIAQAYRRPITEEDIKPFLTLLRTVQATGLSFTDTMVTTYAAVLCSPEFVTMEERPGPLDDYALASRLSYFLWNSQPDATLRTLAAQGKLKNPTVLRAQVNRMLADPRSQQFVEAFLDYWLDLRKANNVSPDELLYSDYYLDDFLVESAVDETRAFFTELVTNNLPARNLIASDFVTINERLATHYGLSGVKGAAIQHVDLPKDSPRGGLLTQASVLKVTANGTTTSPVIRGVWINERVLGLPVPPPPPKVPAVEPDIRGATTIREQLAKHRAEPTCAACHAKIDPAGFALENFDVFGGWRDRYRALGEGERIPGIGKNGQAFAFHAAQVVDASGDLPDGRHFKDVRALKQLLAKDERQVARNLVRQLTIYATGAPIRFSDRPKVEAILDQTKPGEYGVKSLILALVGSDLFRNK